MTLFFYSLAESLFPSLSESCPPGRSSRFFISPSLLYSSWSPVGLTINLRVLFLMHFFLHLKTKKYDKIGTENILTLENHFLQHTYETARKWAAHHAAAQILYRFSFALQEASLYDSTRLWFLRHHYLWIPMATSVLAYMSLSLIRRYLCCLLLSQPETCYSRGPSCSDGSLLEALEIPPHWEEAPALRSCEF